MSRAFKREHLPATILSVALLAMTVSWYFGLHAFQAANAYSKDGWSAAPLGWMFILVFSPLFSLISIPFLLRVKDRLTVLDVAAIVVACSPGVVLIVGAALAFVTR